MEEENSIIFLKEIASFLGVPEIKLDESGLCQLIVQDKYFLIIRFNEVLQRLIIAVELASPDRISGELFHSILTFNAHKADSLGAWIFLDNNGSFFMMDEFFIKITTPDELRERLTQFFDQYLAYQGLFTPEELSEVIPPSVTEEQGISMIDIHNIA